MMRFLVNSQLVDGVTREQFVKYVDDHPVNSSTWDLIRHRVVTEWAFKVGDQPGVMCFMDVDDEAAAREIVDALPVVVNGMLTFQVEPLSAIARF
jgi:hypothetical protein